MKGKNRSMLWILLFIVAQRNVVGNPATFDHSIFNKKQRIKSSACPSIPGAPTRINPGSYIFQFAKQGTICTLTKIKDETIVGVARSYDYNPWEIAPGEFATSLITKEFNCSSGVCFLNLPTLETGDYYLTTYDYTVSTRNELARFLESATFGITQSDISDLEALAPTSSQGKITNWIEHQMSLPFSSHREFWREGASPRLPIPIQNNIPDHPCDAHSRWRKYAFVINDSIIKPGILRVEGSGPYILRVDNKIRAVVDKLRLIDDRNYKFNPNFDYTFCYNSKYMKEEKTDGIITIQLEDGKCTGRIRNPRVDFTNHENLLTNIVTLPSIDDDDGGHLQPIDIKETDREDFILTRPLQDSVCDYIPPIEDTSDQPIFGKLPDGTWLQFDPRLEFNTNTITNPREDGGYAEMKLGVGGGTRCMNAPRTFLNEDKCVLSTADEACRSDAVLEIDDRKITLDEATIVKMHELSGQYVYGVKGLPVLDVDNEMVQHPCTPGTRSRWILKDASSCNPTLLHSATEKALLKLIKKSPDENSMLRDIYFPTSGERECHPDDMKDTRLEILVKGQCWNHVHPDYMSVFDMTYWTLKNKHPGGQYFIQQFANNGQGFLVFPGDSHPISRWEMYKKRFPYVGRFGDEVFLRDLPGTLRPTPDYGQGSKGILVCGSPGEVANKKEKGFLFDSDNPYLNGKEFRSQPYQPGRNREYVWIMVVLNAPDQLRQRIAWALSQILVVATDSIQKKRVMSEWFLNFYDIFVRHAFGNYRDVLKEISYNTLMAENLSFLNSKSFAYNWETRKIKAYADENFAREIMQLFSIGKIELNQDGTAKLDSKGNEILSYTNEDIMSFSRAWTGFKEQPRRSNIEGKNYIDPMEIRADWRDKFPKSDLYGGYIGDSYPLCEDLPPRAFLKKGAMYRLLGNSRLPELMEDPGQFEFDNDIKRLILETTSGLKTMLCNEDPSGECSYRNSVVLESAISCQGNECHLDTVRVVQVSESVFYEYVQPSCVQMVFYDNAKTITPRSGIDKGLCGNPQLSVASAACCKGSRVNAKTNLIYDGERMPFALAKSRCSDIFYETCDSYKVVSGGHQQYFWTNLECSIAVKINEEGRASIVHEPNNDSDTVVHVDEENENWFKVNWDNGIYPSVSNGCFGMCKVLSEGSCLCKTNVLKSTVFDSMPENTADIMSKLHIGAFHPSTYDSHTYTSTENDLMGVTVHLKNEQMDMETIFEFTSDKGQKRFLKNVHETVQLLDTNGFLTPFSFRNMPQFMSLIPAEGTIRDAQYETEAVLDHYFYHDNTAPFIALRLIQRLVSSNPSPRYVKAVTVAFKTGKYLSFGTGNYGDLASTTAAILLDREARNVLLDNDPSNGLLREPLLKVIAILRSMEFVSNQPVTRMDNMVSVIGQMAHGFESVFSFFLPEFKPYASRIGNATLVSPEAMLLDTPKTIGLLNGFTSLVKYGLSHCDEGFAPNILQRKCGKNIDATAQGHLKLTFDEKMEDPLQQFGYSNYVIDELSTLLTAGRLDMQSKEIIRDAFDMSDDTDEALRTAQQLMLTTPAFHSTNFVKPTNEARKESNFPKANGKPYKAVVMIMFKGGCDSFNLLAPYSCTKGNDLYDQYTSVRQHVALKRDQLYPIPASGQICETFGIHKKLPVAKSLYDDGDLLFLANTGVLTRPVNKRNYKELTKTQLFAHNIMQKETKRVDPLRESEGTGVLGRMIDVLTRHGHNVGSFAIDGGDISVIGNAETPPMIVSRKGITKIHISDVIQKSINKLHNKTMIDSGVFAEEWSSNLVKSLDSNARLKDILNTVPNMEFPDTKLGEKLETVSKLIQTREARGADTDIFYIEWGSFDTHQDVSNVLDEHFEEANNAIETFTNTLKSLGLWQNVTTIEVSDFARTLTPNGGNGTDHGWGGNYMMFGGAVKGGEILGTYPEDLTDKGEQNVGRGRLIPSTPWEASYQGIANWLGIPMTHMDEVCPNRDNFSDAQLFTANDMFMNTSPSLAPTSTSIPTTSLTSFSPTKMPTWNPSKESSAVPSSEPTQRISDLPTSQPSNNPSIIPCVDVRLELQTDYWANDISWQVVNNDTNVIVWERIEYPNGSNLYKEENCIDPGCYIFKLYDSYGDGLPDPGYFYFYYDDKMVHESADYTFITESDAFGTTCPTKTPTKTPIKSPSRSPTFLPSESPSGVPTTKPSFIPTTTVSPSVIPTAQPSSFPTVLPSVSPSIEPSISPTASPSVTQEPSTSPTALPSTSPTAEPSISPSELPSTTQEPSLFPTTLPSASPTAEPSISPSSLPSASQEPSISPTTLPSVSPTTEPSLYPTTKPSLYPSTKPSIYPTALPTATKEPSVSPTALPSTTQEPSISPTTLPSATQEPSFLPTALPSTSPTAEPSISPSELPSASQEPSLSPTTLPSVSPTIEPSLYPTTAPSIYPTAFPSTTQKPSVSPTTLPSTTQVPSISPTTAPSIYPTAFPSTTQKPSVSPTTLPSTTQVPSISPTILPSATRTTVPSTSPTVEPSPTSSIEPSTFPTTTDLPSTALTKIPSRSILSDRTKYEQNSPEFETSSTSSSRKPSYILLYTGGFFIYLFVELYQ